MSVEREPSEAEIAAAVAVSEGFTAFREIKHSATSGDAVRLISSLNREQLEAVVLAATYLAFGGSQARRLENASHDDVNAWAVPARPWGAV